MINYVLISIVCGTAIICVLLILWFITRWNTGEGNVFQNNKDLDSTLTTGGGIIIAMQIITFLFVAHMMKNESGESLLTQGIVMALINIPQTMFAYALGKKNGESAVYKDTNKDTNSRIEKIESYLRGDDEEE